MKPGIRLGILGGGQLARMLAISAHQMGVSPWIFSNNKNDPAQQVTANSVIGALDDKKALKNFFNQVDLVTFESEFLNVELLKNIDSKKKLSPSPEIMGIVQDRRTQKELLDSAKIPTAPWLSVTTLKDALYAQTHLGFPLVFKKRRFGYDGYGTFIVKTKKDLQSFIDNEFNNKGDGFIAEKWIPFKRELACIFARNGKNEVVHYPLVESFQKNARCFWVKGPINHKSFNKWTTTFKKLLKKANYVGVMGVELFETDKGLIVNELAPRVHNSGHYTQDAFAVNQFDLHIKAILDQPLTLPKQSYPGFAMVNLLGDEKLPRDPQWTIPKEVKLHWYGKSENRPGRKMGHINVVSASANEALKLALSAHKRFQL